MLQGFGKDLRHALRALRRSPGFTLAAVAALALGIGATTAVFSVVNAVLLAPLGIADTDRLVLFATTSPQGSTTTLSPAEYHHFQELTAVVEHAAAYSASAVNYTGGAFPEQLRSARVGSEFFRCLGAAIERGRGFTAAEDIPGAGRVVVLSRGFWASRFESDPAMIGRSLSIGGEPHEVIGVLGDLDLSAFGESPQVYLPFPLEPGGADHTHYFQAVGKLASGVSLEEARARVAASKPQYLERHPKVLADDAGLTVDPINEVLVRGANTSLAVLSGAVALVLLIACANVAHLLLARATGREREVALRTALGGSRRRIARQLLTESVVLALLGGVLGSTLGVVGMRALLAVNTADLPRVGPNGAGVDVDWRVLAFTLAISVVTGLVFGAAPAWQTARADLGSMLKEGGRTGSGSRHRRARATMVVSEIALALVLLVGSALLIRTMIALQRVEPGFDVEHVVTLRTSLAESRFHPSEAVERLVRDGAERLRALPGIEQTSASCCVPLLGGLGLPFSIVGRPPADDGPFHGGGSWTTVSPGYFEVFRIPIRRGRTFTERDDASSPAVVVINETMARQFWPDADPIGQRLVIGRGVAREFESEREREIVGVIADTRAAGLASDPDSAMFIPQAQLPDAVNKLNVGFMPLAWVVRTKSEPGAMLPAIQKELSSITGMPVTDARVMSEVLRSSTSRERFNMWLMTVFAVAALLLAAIGVYGLLAYSVEQRTHEIGIRVAIGAEASQVRRMVVREGMQLALAGVVIGLAASFALARFIAGFLYGVRAWDPVAFTLVPLVLGTVALLAVWLPARRASRIDPIVALRYE